MLLVVAESNGSSPGRAGYKMAVASDGELSGSIGGGVMEVALADAAKLRIEDGKFITRTELVEQVHQKNSPDSSGMICSGRQTVIAKQLTTGDADAIIGIIDALESGSETALTISQDHLNVMPAKIETPKTSFEKHSETEFTYAEKIGVKNKLYIIGGGHCALALSELMSRLGFRISIFDDRPELNTIAKNNFADVVTIIGGYDQIGEVIPNDNNIYVVVMTLGYKFDEIVIRKLFNHEFKYFGVLGSKAKMKTLLTTLENEGFAKEKLQQIHTPIGLPINSRSPDEIAVSIAAEIIAVKNS